jgi:hypothetical protein
VSIAPALALNAPQAFGDSRGVQFLDGAWIQEGQRSEERDDGADRVERDGHIARAMG